MTSAISYFNTLANHNFRKQVIIPEIAEAIGLNEHAALQQVHYWITKCRKSIRGKLWIYNTFDDWKKQFPYWSITKIKRIFYSLEKKGYIISRQMKARVSDHTKWYTINYDKLINLALKLISRESLSSEQSTLPFADTVNYRGKSEVAKATLYSNIIRNNFHIHTIIPEIANALKLEHSIVLQQKHYWLTKCGKLINGKLWIYNTFNDWKKQFPYWSLSKIKRIFYSLEQQGYIESKKMNIHKGSHIKWYSIDYENLMDLVNQFTSTEKESKISKIPLVQNDTISNIRGYKPSFHDKEVKNHVSKKKKSQFSKIKVHNLIPKTSINFYSIQIELPLVQIDTINNKYTYTNHTKTSSYEEKEMNCFNEINQPEELARPFQEIIQKMVEVWNNTFQYALKPINAYESEENNVKLLELWNTIFEQDLDKWREYAIKVNSSKFLMGEKITKNNFKATFSWLLKSDTAKKIMSGEYGVGDRELDCNNVSENIEAAQKEFTERVTKTMETHVRSTSLLSKEDKEFREYLKKQKYIEDGDPYKLQWLNNPYSPRDRILLDIPETRELYNELLSSYITKKTTGYTSLELRSLINKVTGKLSEKMNGVNLLSKLKESINMINKAGLSDEAPVNLPSLLEGIDSACSKQPKIMVGSIT